MTQQKPVADDEPGDGAVPQYAKGGLVLGPDGGDTIPVWLEPSEHWYTADQVRRFMAAKPGSEDALRSDNDGTAPA